MKQDVYIGKGSINNLEDILAKTNARTVFLVTGKASYLRSGAKEALDRILVDGDVTCFSDFERNPQIEDLLRGIELFNRRDFDVVLAVGGGSVIDMAKMVNFFAVNQIDPNIYDDTKPVNVCESSRLIAVPTTSGTGSEVTHFAVLYIDHAKHSVEHKHILPRVAIVDPGLTASMPAAVAASTGLDALSHGIESFWCINSTAESKVYAREAIQLVMANLEKAVIDPDDPSRDAMARAAHLAGKAINITKTTAPHAISYPLTSYFRVPHGHAAALTLSSMLEFNYQVKEEDILDSRGVDYVLQTIDELINILQAIGIMDAKSKLDKLINAVDLSGKLRDLGVKDDEGLELIIEHGFNSNRAGNNPRKLTREALKDILANIY